MNSTVWRNFVKEIAPYIPGKSMEEVKRTYNIENVIRLASNENPFGPSPKSIEAAAGSLLDMKFYPDTTARELREELARLYDIQPDEIMTANGADNILTILISAYVNEGDEVIYCTPTFPSYRSTTILMGGTPIEVPLTEDWKYDLDSILSSITDKTKLIFICNPNNPTGTILSPKEITTFLDKVPKEVQVIIDEAYTEYIEESNYITGIDMFKKLYPIITIRTFSKYYGLAGLRVGYAIASKGLLEPMLRIREPFAINRIAINAAVAALKDQNYYEDHLTKIKDGKEYLTKELSNLGFDVIKSHSNFLFVNVKRDSLVLFEQLLQRGIIIRPCTPWGYKEYIRISIGTQEQNELLIALLTNIQADYVVN